MNLLQRELSLIARMTEISIPGSSYQIRGPSVMVRSFRLARFIKSWAVTVMNVPSICMMLCGEFKFASA
jgi:hypothetical protein